jgi:hypothetical protein
VANRWLLSTGYVPSHSTGGTNGNRAESPRSSNPGSGGPEYSRPFSSAPPVQQQATPSGLITLLLPSLAHTTSIGASLVAIAIATHALRSGSIVLPEPVLSESTRPFGAIKLERTRDAASANRLAEKYAPGAKGLIFDWNGDLRKLGNHHFVYPNSSLRAQSFYVPVPRPGWKLLFSQLQHTGLSGINLYEVHPPEAWTPGFLDALKYKWALGCAVKPDWIDLWSSFRSPDFTVAKKLWSQLQRPLDHPEDELRNGCRPGGTCFVISNECASTTFEGL